jgi:hypothetical protein
LPAKASSISAHDRPKSLLTIPRNPCSRSSEIHAHDAVKSVLTITRNTHGGTEAGLNWVDNGIDQDPTPLLFVSPTLTVVTRTSARVQPMIDDDPGRLGSKVQSSHPSRRDLPDFDGRRRHRPHRVPHLGLRPQAAALAH